MKQSEYISLVDVGISGYIKVHYFSDKRAGSHENKRVALETVNARYGTNFYDIYRVKSTDRIIQKGGEVNA